VHVQVVIKVQLTIYMIEIYQLFHHQVIQELRNMVLHHHATMLFLLQLLKLLEIGLIIQLVTIELILLHQVVMLAQMQMLMVMVMVF